MKLNYRVFKPSLLGILLINLFCFSACTKRSVQSNDIPERPNILFITADYQASVDIPRETKQLIMPNLDQLCEEGVVFQKHYCTAPICMPSRYTIVSGRYPHYHKAWDNMGHWLPEGTPVLMKELKKAGYKTVGIGKMHFHPWERMAGFDERIFIEGKGNRSYDTTRHDEYAAFLSKAGLTRWDYLKKQNEGEIFGVYDWPFADSLHIDHYTGERAADYIETTDLSDPFFMWISFNGPHNPWDPPAEYTKPYLNQELPDPKWRKGELEEELHDVTAVRYNYTRSIPDLIDRYPKKRDSIINRIRAGHYGGLSFIDDQLGKILKSLKDKDLDKNTLVIYTSDHGCHLGNHDLIHKGTHYDRSARVPFILWMPEYLNPGERTGFSEHTDIMPTFLELAGAEPPSGLEGESLVSMFEGKNQGDDKAFIEIRNTYAVVTDNFVFATQPATQQEVLFDKKKDPDELYNIIKRKEYKNDADRLREILYDFHKPLDSLFKEGKPLPDLPASIKVEKGQDPLPVFGLYPGGKAFRLKLEFSYSKNNEGPLFTYFNANTHGLSLFIKNGKLLSGIRTFGNDQIEIILQNIKEGTNKIEFELSDTGKMQVMIDNEIIKEFQTEWPMPVQPGSEHYFTGSWKAGESGNRWFNPIGGYASQSQYSGEKVLVTFSLI